MNWLACFLSFVAGGFFFVWRYQVRMAEYFRTNPDSYINHIICDVLEKDN